jgi:hypothetical protein
MAFDANILLRGAAMNQQKQSDLFNRLYGMQRDKQQDALRQQQIQAQQASAQQAQANADRNFQLQERLAEFKMNQPADFEQQVRGAAMRLFSGQGSPEDEALVKFQSALEGPKTSYQADPYGNVKAVTQPTLFDRLQGRTPGINPDQPNESLGQRLGLPPNSGIVPDRPNTPMNVGPMGQGSNPAINTPYDQISPASGFDGLLNNLQRQNTLEMNTGDVMNTPYQQKGTFDAQTAVDVDAAKQDKSLENQKRLIEFENQMKLSTEEKSKIPGRQEFDEVLGEVLTNLQELKGKGAATSEDNSTLKNIGAYFRNTETLDPFGLTPGGQDVERALGTEAQTIRDKIKGREPRLFNAIKKASGLTGTELNSQYEVENQLRQLGNAEMSYDAREDLLKSLSSQFGTGQWSNFGDDEQAPQGKARVLRRVR